MYTFLNLFFKVSALLRLLLLVSLTFTPDHGNNVNHL